MKIAVLVSGRGSNLKHLLETIENKKLSHLKITHVIADRKAKALDVALDRDIPCFLLTQEENISNQLNELLRDEVELIVLAGFLSILSKEFCERWTHRMINIHPSLLPKYGGRGMYGMKVHEAIIANKDTRSGASVHYVSEEIDKGEIILQKAIQVAIGETPFSLAKKVQKIEHEILIEALERIYTNLLIKKTK